MMDGPKLLLFGHTRMQPHFDILLPFVRLKKMEAQQANKKTIRFRNPIQYIALG